MSKEFSYPEFENGVKVLSAAGDAVNDMMMDITIYKMEGGETRTFFREAEETAGLNVNFTFALRSQTLDISFEK